MGRAFGLPTRLQSPVLAFIQNLIRGPNLLILLVLAALLFVVLRRSDNKPKSD